jgi:formamidopyrimidine-DNA glycosylase
MTGSLLLNPEQTDPCTRIIFQLDNGSHIVFSDRRRLGVVWLSDNTKQLNQKLGPEPLEEDFTVKTLALLLQKRQAPIKAVLLDQKFVAGIGNMYADEALFHAKIHPLRKASSLSRKEIQKLYQAIRNVLHNAIESKGASIDTYRRPDGDKGTAHFHFHVAHKRGESCPRCGTIIERQPIRNRGSYYCRVCQT